MLAKHLDNVLQQMQAPRRARWFLCPGYATSKMFKYLEIPLGNSNFDVIDFVRFSPVLKVREYFHRFLDRKLDKKLSSQEIIILVISLD